MPQSQQLTNQQVQQGQTQNIQLSGRRVINAGDAVDPQDYITLSQANTLILAAQNAASSASSTTKNTLNGTVPNGVGNGLIYVGPGGKLASNGTAITDGAGSITITNKLKCSQLQATSLTALRFVITDASSNLISAGVAGVSGALTLTQTTGALSISYTTAVVSGTTVVTGVTLNNAGTYLQTSTLTTNNFSGGLRIT